MKTISSEAIKRPEFKILKSIDIDVFKVIAKEAYEATKKIKDKPTRQRMFILTLEDLIEKRT